MTIWHKIQLWYYRFQLFWKTRKIEMFREWLIK